MLPLSHTPIRRRPARSRLRRRLVLFAASLALGCGVADAQISNPQPGGPPLQSPWRMLQGQGPGGTNDGSGLFGFGTGTHLWFALPTPAASIQQITACGTSPLLSASSDTFGKLTTGSGTVNSCAVAFGNPFTAIPRCFVQQATGTPVLETVATTTTGFTIAFAASAPSSQFNWFCASIINQ